MIALWIALAFAQDPIGVADAPIAFDSVPTVGVETTITVADAFGGPRVGATVQVVHRPGLAGERHRAIGITDSRGRVRWVPEVGGVAHVRGADDSLRVSVARAEAPASTVALLGLLVVAGLALAGYGGLSRRVRRTAEPR